MRPWLPPFPVKIDSTELLLLAADGYPLKVTRFAHHGALRGRLIVAGATGIRQRFYRHFARFAADQGLEVWTIDYRGVGLSRPAELRGFEMSYLDWALLDLRALLDHVAAQGDGLIWMVGHSYGGHAFGLLPGHDRVQRFVTFATGAGWHGWMPLVERIRVQLMWNLMGPLLVRAKGYLAWSLLGLGEDLPLGVYRQWRRWCAWPRYFFDDPECAGFAERFAQVRTPIRAINASDDRWAPPASRDAFMAAYVNAPLELITIEPQDYGMKSIGHVDYFRPEASELWQQTLDWLLEGTPVDSE